MHSKGNELVILDYHVHVSLNLSDKWHCPKFGGAGMLKVTTPKGQPIEGQRKKVWHILSSKILGI